VTARSHPLAAWRTTTPNRTTSVDSGDGRGADRDARVAGDDIPGRRPAPILGRSSKPAPAQRSQLSEAGESPRTAIACARPFAMRSRSATTAPSAINSFGSMVGTAFERVQAGRRVPVSQLILTARVRRPPWDGHEQSGSAVKPAGSSDTPARLVVRSRTSRSSWQPFC